MLRLTILHLIYSSFTLSYILQAAVLETQIYSEAGSLLNGNYRPPQNLNGRSIQTPPECKRGNNAPVVRLSIATLLSVFLLTLIFQQH